MRTIYLSGPMKGLPERNFPAFHAETARLRALGYKVVNPAEVNAGLPDDLPYMTYIRRDLVAMIGQGCDTIAFLPGWELSRGANIERDVASRLEMIQIMADMITDLCSYVKPAAPPPPSTHRFIDVVERPSSYLTARAEASVERFECDHLGNPIARDQFFEKHGHNKGMANGTMAHMRSTNDPRRPIVESVDLGVTSTVAQRMQELQRIEENATGALGAMGFPLSTDTDSCRRPDPPVSGGGGDFSGAGASGSFDSPSSDSSNYGGSD